VYREVIPVAEQPAREEMIKTMKHLLIVANTPSSNSQALSESSIERIVTGLRWKPVPEPLICAGEFRQACPASCEELGMTIAAGLEAGIY
jgi:hypothetical protein